MSRRRQLFKPGKRFPHCPNPECRFHRPHPDWRYARFGILHRKSDDRRFVRYQCVTCRRTFCTRTVAADYWLRYRELLPVIASQVVNGAGFRQIGRNLGVAHGTVQRQVSRVGRHCLLFQRRELSDVEIKEPLVIDGFETFEYSQYFPCHFNLAVGQNSGLLYFFTDSPLRRKGTMTAAQRKRRAELEHSLGRPDPQAVRKGIGALLEPLRFPAAPPEMLLHSDQHPAYVPALRDLRRARPELRIRHLVTSSKERRTTSNPLFEVNRTDLLIRHGGADHKRETIAFDKRRQGGAERLAVFAVWKNWIKRWRENDPVNQDGSAPDAKAVRAGRGGLASAGRVRRTAATVAGLASRAWGWGEVLRRRLFVGHQQLPPPWVDYYWRRVKTAALGDRQTVHQLTYAA